MAGGTPISKVIETIERVEIIQKQLQGIVDTLDQLNVRVSALEKAAGGRGP